MKASNRQDSKIRIVETEAITVEPERIDEKTEELRFGQQVLARMEKNRRIAIKKGHRKKIDDDNHATFRVIQKPDLKNTFVYVIHACGILESQSKILEALTKNYDCHDAFRLADMSKEEPRDIIADIIKISGYPTLLKIEDGAVVDLIVGERGGYSEKRLKHFLFRNGVGPDPGYVERPKNSKIARSRRYRAGDDMRKFNLRGAFFQNGEMSGADFRGADLSFADLRETNLSRANFLPAPN